MKKGVGILSKIFNFLKIYLKKFDPIFWTIANLISIYCLVLVASVSRTGINFFKTQLIAVIIGYLGAMILSDIDYRKIVKYWYIPAAVCFVLIALTFFIGKAVEGHAGVNARAWIKLPFNINFQPSELAKIGFIITFSKHLYALKQKDLLKSFLQIVFLAVHAFIPVLLTHIQGDDGAAIIFFFMFLFMSFTAGIQFRYFAMILVLIIIAVPIVWNYLMADYQKLRLLSQLNPESDPLGIGFQQNQGKISIGSGRIWGQGLFQGPRVGVRGTVPIQESDFIFSVAGEELGFIGCSLVLILLISLLFRTLYVAHTSYDILGSYICCGFFGMVLSQIALNLGMCLGFLPVIGVTLPFFSAGGSSAACLYLGLGLVQSVFQRREDENLEDNPEFIE